MFWKEWYDLRLRFFIILIVFIFMLIMTIAMRPYTSTMMDQISEEFGNLPDFLKNLIGDPKLLNQLENDDFYLLSQWFGKNLGQFLPIIALIIAFPIFARETEKKTIYFILSRMKREKVFWSKYITGLSFTKTLIGTLTLLGPLGMKIAGYDVHISKPLLILVHEIIAMLFLYSLYIMFSIIFNDQVKPILAGLVTVFIMPIFSFVESLSFLNIYPYLMGQSVINNHGIDWNYSIVLLALSIVLIFIDKKLFMIKEF
jgi:ABC-type transport system involved in multi-copper enzyme maturation permease subunit